jgi:hypothetical protein
MWFVIAMGILTGLYTVAVYKEHIVYCLETVEEREKLADGLLELVYHQ